MVNEMFFTLACAGLTGILFGLTLTFAGYRFFLFLLPLWGFVFGLVLSAQTMQAIFGHAFLATVTSWVVGLVVGGVFALLSYLFYLSAVAITAGSLGYFATVGILLAIGLPMGLMVWLIGLAVAVLLSIVTIRFDLAKWVITVATAVLGAGTIIGAIVLMFNPVATFLANPVQAILRTSPLAAIMFIVVAVLGLAVQIKQNRNFNLTEYDRWTNPAI